MAGTWDWVPATTNDETFLITIFYVEFHIKNLPYPYRQKMHGNKNMKIPLKPIKPKKISDQVFDQIRELIFRGSLKPGEKMMSERELAEAMQVSRSTIRDAIQRLVVMGIVVHKQGQGTFVKAITPLEETPLAKIMQAQDASIEDLLEVRMGLECNAAALAAQRADESDINAMENSINEMKREIASGRLGTTADTSFHMAIAYAAKNPLQILIMRNFYDYLFHGIRENLANLYEIQENIEKVMQQHLNIIEAIKSRNAYKAYSAMKAHIEFVVIFFKEKKDGIR